MLVMMMAAAVLLGGAAQNNPSQTEEATPPQAAQPEREADEGDRVICRREHVVGSNRPQRICLPKREWDAMRDDARNNADRLNRGAPEIIESRPSF